MIWKYKTNRYIINSVYPMEDNIKCTAPKTQLLIIYGDVSISGRYDFTKCKFKHEFDSHHPPPILLFNHCHYDRTRKKRT